MCHAEFVFKVLHYHPLKNNRVKALPIKHFHTAGMNTFLPIKSSLSLRINFTRSMMEATWRVQ